MKHVLSRCPKCDEKWNDEYWTRTNVGLDYNVIDESLTVKCGRCSFITTTFCHDAKGVDVG